MLPPNDTSLSEAHRAEEQQFIPPRYLRGRIRRDRLRTCLRVSACSTTSHSPYRSKLASAFSDRSSITINRISGLIYTYFDVFRHSRTNATVRHGHVVEDGFDKLAGTNLKQPIQITFIGGIE